MISHIASFCAGASVALVWAMLRMTRRKPGITKAARRDQHEFVQRRYRDAVTVETVPTWERNEVGGIDYRFLGQTGEEV